MSSATLPKPKNTLPSRKSRVAKEHCKRSHIGSRSPKGRQQEGSAFSSPRTGRSPSYAIAADLCTRVTLNKATASRYLAGPRFSLTLVMSAMPWPVMSKAQPKCACDVVLRP